MKEVVPKGGGASVLVREQGELVVHDRSGHYGRKGVDRHLKVDVLARDEWVRSAGRWKVRRSDKFREQLLVDGKVWRGKWAL